ncbi:MAG: O-succinylhomoserine sulfhydrylase [Rhodospirillales bacterium]|nr:O-succinylhomoserine sulfhydrylase [Rhodospirillales bacterium]MBO6787528.1 O-succinylhomoserine sulfhydrylase [Rhodospirillales bacterium]
MSSKDNSQNSWRPATQLVRGGTARSPFEETSEAIFLTSGYVYPTADEAELAFKGDKLRYIYSRYANPTLNMFEQRLALLEDTEYCVSTSSGMSAVFAALASQLKAGDRVVASKALFGSCLYIIADQLPKFGIETELVDGTDYEAWAKALSKPANVVFLETPSNPCLEVIDIAKVSELAHTAGAKVVVDNVFATPVLQRPIALGADIVVYSATKHIDGQGRTLGGAILTNDQEFIEDHLTPWMRHTGPALSPFNAWVLLKGLETLAVRVRQHCDNAAKVATFLETHPKIEKAIYPGLKSHPQHNLALAQMSGQGSSLVAFEIKGGKAASFSTLNALSIVDISNNLGDAKSLITHPATTTHQRLSDDEKAALGISDGLVRLSVGLEDADDLIEDLDQALACA